MTRMLRLLSLTVLLLCACYATSSLPVANAFDSSKIVLPSISDKANYRSRELNEALWKKLSSQFRFPKYEIERIDSLNVTPERALLEKITAERAAEGLVTLEITQVQSFVSTTIVKDEVYEETSLSMTLTYFNKKTGQYGQLSASRSIVEQSTANSGPLPLSLSMLEEMLNKLDSVFPRQFPGPRY